MLQPYRLHRNSWNPQRNVLQRGHQRGTGRPPTWSTDPLFHFRLHGVDGGHGNLNGWARLAWRSQHPRLRGCQSPTGAVPFMEPAPDPNQPSPPTLCASAVAESSPSVLVVIGSQLPRRGRSGALVLDR